MTAGFWRDKLPHLLLPGLSISFSAVLLAVLGVAPAAIAFLCVVLALGTVLPLIWEWGRKAAFYRAALGWLEGLDEKYLLCELLDPPSFWEGTLYAQTIRTLADSMAGKVADARRDMREYREYIEIWIHEVKTPLASAQLLLEGASAPLAQGMGDELFRLEGYVDQALFYARSGSVEHDHLIAAVTLRQLCTAAVKRHARPLIAAGFQIRMEGVDRTVYSDPKWVEFLLCQLLSNAVKYRGDAPTVTFTGAECADHVTLSLHDDGVGISDPDLPRVFEKGFTGQNGRADAAKATGLGLYLCKKLSLRLGLGLTIRSQPGAGTTVCLTFPKGRHHLAD